MAKYNDGGWEALKARPVPSRPPSLTDEQLLELYAVVAGNDPRQLQFKFALWTPYGVCSDAQRFELVGSGDVGAADAAGFYVLPDPFIWIQLRRRSPPTTPRSGF